MSAPSFRSFFTPARLGAVIFLAVALPCFLALPWVMQKEAYNGAPGPQMGPGMGAGSFLFGTDGTGRSLLARCLLGGAISLTLGFAAATVAVSIGVVWGALAGYVGGRVDAFLMRVVDVLYGLPTMLIVVMVAVGLMGVRDRFAAAVAAGKEAGELSLGLRLVDVMNNNPLAVNLVALVLAIGSVSWLTMARVIRGQVLSLKAQPFIESARAVGCSPVRIFFRHLLPNCAGPIIVYATLAVPSEILFESFLSFLGIGVQAPLPSWGSLAADGVRELAALRQEGLTVHWWMLVFPCGLLGLTLLALNFLGDAARDRFDPRSAK